MIIFVTIVIIVRSLDRCLGEGQAGLVCFDSCILAAPEFHTLQLRCIAAHGDVRVSLLALHSTEIGFHTTKHKNVRVSNHAQYLVQLSKLESSK